jgi:hypothetical protein
LCGPPAVLEKIAGKEVLVSITAVKEFLAKGDSQALREFLAANHGRIARSAPEAVVGALTRLGLDRKDAMVVGSAVREGVRIITGDRAVIKRVPGLVDPI